MHNRAVEAQQQVEQQLADEPRIIVSRAQRCMATQVSVQLAVPPQQARAAESSADAVLAFLREVDTRLSRFRPESELCALNRAVGGWFVASPLLFEAVEAALRAAHASGGLFDPALLPQLEALGYDRDFDLIARGESATGQPAGTFAPGAWRDIELEAGGRRIRLPRGLRLDLGGIAKGWAADVAIERLCAPFAHALVNVGGDLRLRGGPQPGASWTAGIRDPPARSALGAARAALDRSRGRRRADRDGNGARADGGAGGGRGESGAAARLSNGAACGGRRVGTRRGRRAGGRR